MNFAEVRMQVSTLVLAGSGSSCEEGYSDGRPLHVIRAWLESLSMKPDIDYIKQMLDVMRASPGWATPLAEFEAAGLQNDFRLAFHMAVLLDQGLVEVPYATNKIDIQMGMDRMDAHLGSLPHRLKSQGHDFAAQLTAPSQLELARQTLVHQGLDVVLGALKAAALQAALATARGMGLLP
jgi:hypothetical protein